MLYIIHSIYLACAYLSPNVSPGTGTRSSNSPSTIRAEHDLGGSDKTIIKLML